MTRIIYQIGSNGFWTGERLSIEDIDPVPTGWTDRPLPTLAVGEVAAWGADDWVATQARPQTGAPTPTIDEADRRQLYIDFADPLFFRWQAGEASKADWLAMRSAIKTGLKVA